MATISFKEDLIIQETKTIKKVAEALKQPKDPKIQAAQPTKLPKNAESIWFKRSGN